MFDIPKAIKVMRAARRYTLVRLTEEYNKRTGANYTNQGLSYKINHDALKLSEFFVICDILGYDFIVEDKKTHVKIQG